MKSIALGFLGIFLLSAFGCTLTAAQERQAMAIAATAPATPAAQTPEQADAIKKLKDDATLRERGEQAGNSIQTIGAFVPQPYGLIASLLGIGVAAYYKRKSDKTDTAAGLVVNSIEALKVAGVLKTEQVIKPAATDGSSPATTVGDLLDTVQKEAGKALVDKHQT